MDRLVTGLATKSAKIRALGRAGYARADIARYLDVRYQHVRNVLVHAETKEGEGNASNLPPQVWTQVGADGRVVIPAPYRDLLDVDGGGHVLMTVDGREIRLLSRDAAVRRAQELVARHVPAGVSLVDELMVERRAEAARENGVGSGRT